MIKDWLKALKMTFSNEAITCTHYWVLVESKLTIDKKGKPRCPAICYNCKKCGTIYGDAIREVRHNQKYLSCQEINEMVDKALAEKD